MQRAEQEFYFGYLRRLDDGRVLGRVAFDASSHATLPEIELGRIGRHDDPRTLRAALAVHLEDWIRRAGWSRLPAARPRELATPPNVTACLVPARLTRDA